LHPLHTQDVGLQVVIGFVFPLVGQIPTKQFQVKDIRFWNYGSVLPWQSNLATFLTVDEATMIISNQKNGVRGNQLHHKVNGTSFCPVVALVRRVHHILANGGNKDSVLGPKHIF
jgi:hypothetical protein